MHPYTDRQHEVLTFISEFSDKYDRAPQRSEIAKHFGFTNSAAVAYVQRLRRHKLLSIDKKTRAILPPGPVITPRQRDVLRFVQTHVKRHDCAPTRAEIGLALDISRPTAEQHLQALRRAGLVTLRTQWCGMIFLREPTRAKRPTTGA